MCYGVSLPARKLKPYFQEHRITVLCTTRLGDIMGNRDAAVRIAKWAIQLGDHHITYESSTTVKSHALADFLIEWVDMEYLSPPPDYTHWRMHFGGSKMHTILRVDIVLTSAKDDQLQYVLQIHSATSNNVAEYEALIHGLRLAKEIGVRCILYIDDSYLVVQQVTFEWDTRDANMASYRFLVQ